MILENHQTTSYLRHDDYVYIYIYTQACVYCIYAYIDCKPASTHWKDASATLRSFITFSTLTRSAPGQSLFKKWQSVHGRRSNMSDPPNNSVWPWGLFNEMNAQAFENRWLKANIANSRCPGAEAATKNVLSWHGMHSWPLQHRHFSEECSALKARSIFNLGA